MPFYKVLNIDIVFIVSPIPCLFLPFLHLKIHHRFVCINSFGDEKALPVNPTKPKIKQNESELEPYRTGEEDKLPLPQNKFNNLCTRTLEIHVQTYSPHAHTHTLTKYLVLTF